MDPKIAMLLAALMHQNPAGAAPQQPPGLLGGTPPLPPPRPTVMHYGQQPPGIVPPSAAFPANSGDVVMEGPNKGMPRNEREQQYRQTGN
jgi:hypothetical protein